ncbi:MAG: Ig-like domain-containing protein [Planctomycetes bacterium]|nr:Ig-like domain-containing protein [Planctomycetota bacterium]
MARSNLAAPLIVLVLLLVAAVAFLYSTFSGGSDRGTRAERFARATVSGHPPTKPPPARQGRGPVAAPAHAPTPATNHSAWPAPDVSVAAASQAGALVTTEADGFRVEGDAWEARMTKGQIAFGRRGALSPPADGSDPHKAPASSERDASDRPAAPKASFSLALREVRQGNTVAYDARWGSPPAPVERDGRYVFARGPAIEESFEIRREGIEQVISVDRPLAEGGDLVLLADLHTELVPTRREPDDGPIQFLDGRSGIPLLSYGSATVVDSASHASPVATWVEGEALALAVPEDFLKNCRYPLHIDPLLGVDQALAPRGDVSLTFLPASGNYLALFTQLNALGLFASRLGPDGSVLGERMTVRADVRCSSPRVVAGGGSGRSLAVWAEWSSNVCLRGAIFNDDGSLHRAPFTIAPYSDNVEVVWRPSTGAGDWEIAWGSGLSYGSSTTEARLFRARIAVDGSVSEPPTAVYSEPNNAAGVRCLAFDPEDNRTLLCWQRQNPPTARILGASTEWPAGSGPATAAWNPFRRSFRLLAAGLTAPGNSFELSPTGLLLSSGASVAGGQRAWKGRMLLSEATNRYMFVYWYFWRTYAQEIDAEGRVSPPIRLSTSNIDKYYYGVSLAYDPTRQRFLAALNDGGRIETQLVTPTDTWAPSRVERLTATAGNRFITLDWPAAVAEDRRGYWLSRAPSAAGPFVRIHDAPLTETSYVDPDRPPGVAWFYQVASVDLTGNCSAPSPVASATAYHRTPPPAPADVALAPLDRRCTASWSPVAGAEVVSYRIYLREGAGAWSPAGEVAASVLSATIGNLVNGHAYELAVSCSDRYGNESALSAPPVAVVPVDHEAPSATTGLSTTPARGAVVCAWARGPEDDILGYFVLRAAVAGGPTVVLNPDAPVAGLSFVDSTAPASCASFYSIRPVDAAGNQGPPSVDIPGVPAAAGDVTPPGRAVGLVADALDGAVTLHWTPATDTDLATQEVHRASPPGSAFVKVATLGPAASSFSETGLQNDVEFAYVILEIDASGNFSEPSDPVVGRPTDLTPPPAVVAPAVVAGNRRAVASWPRVAGVNDVAGYQVLRRPTGSGVPGVIVSGPQPVVDPQWTDTNLTNNVEYEWAIVCLDTHGNAAPASPWTAGTPRYPTPSGLRTTEVGVARVALAAQPLPEPDVAGYRFLRRDIGGLWVVLNDTLLTNPVYADEGIVAGDYEYAVLAAATNGDESLPSAPVIAHPAPVPAPALDAAGAGAGTTDDNTPVVTGSALPGFRVRVTESGLAVGSATAAADGRFAVPSTAVLADGPHEFRAAQTAPGPGGATSPLSEPATIVVSTVPQSVLARAIVGVVRVTWADNPRSDLRYQVFRSSVEAAGGGEPAPPPVRLTSAPVAGTSWRDVPADSGTYSYRVLSVNASGQESALSAAAEVVIDLTPPSLVSISPADGATDVAVDSPVVVTFSEPIAPGTANEAQGLFLVDPARARVLDASVTWDGAVATISPKAPLEHGSFYQVSVSTAVTDLAGNALVPPSQGVGGISQFRTVAIDLHGMEAFGPLCVGLVFGDGSVWARSYPTSTWRVQFSRPLDPATISPEVVSFRAQDAEGGGGGGSLVPVRVELGPDAMELRVTPLTPLPVGGVALVVRSTVTDLAGHGLGWTPGGQAADLVLGWNSIWEDVDAPQVVACRPVAGSLGIPTTADVRLRFTEPVDPATVTSETVQVLVNGTTAVAGTFVFDDLRRDVTFRPAVALAPEASFEVRVSTGVRDLFGHALDQDPETEGEQSFVARFRTGPADADGQFVVGVGPYLHGASLHPEARPTLVFSERLASAAAASAGLTVTANGVAVDGAWSVGETPEVLVFLPASPLPFEAALAVAVSPADGPRDGAGNGFNQTPLHEPLAPFRAEWTVLSEAEILPRIVFDTPGAWTNDPFPRIEARIFVTGALPQECDFAATVDGEPAQLVTPPLSSGGVLTFYGGTWLDEGSTHVASLTVTAPAGWTVTETRTFRFESGAPRILSMDPPPDRPLAAPAATLRLTYEDDLSGVDSTAVTFSIDGGPEIPPTVAAAGEASLTLDPPLASGPHWVNVFVRDRAGNFTAGVWAPLEVDGEGPSIDVLEPVPDSLVPRVPDVRAMYVDSAGVDPQSVHVIVDGAEATLDPATAVDGVSIVHRLPADLAQGVHTFTVRAADLGGNAAERTWSFTYDSLAPSATLVTPTAGAMVASPRPEVRIDLADGAAGSGIDPLSIYLYVAGWESGWTLEGTTLVFAPDADLPSGEQPIVVDLRDRAGNTTHREWRIVVDPAGTGVTPGPDLAFVSPTQNQVVRTATPTIELAFSATADLIDSSTLHVILDPFSDAPRNLTLEAVGTPTGARIDIAAETPLTQGAHELTAELSDIAGHRSIAFVVFTVDLRGPQLAILTPPAAAILRTSRPMVRLAFSDNGVAVNRASLRIVLDPGTPREQDLAPLATDISGGAELDLPAWAAFDDGAHEVRAELADVEGRESTSTLAFRVDTAPPTIQVITGGEGGVSRDPSGTIRVVLADAGSGIADATFRATLDRGTASEQDLTSRAIAGEGEMRVPFVGAALFEGSHTLFVSVGDNAGGVASFTQSFTVDATAPTMTVLGSRAGTVVSVLAPPIEVAYNDALSGTDPSTACLWVNGQPIQQALEVTAAHIAFRPTTNTWSVLNEGTNRLRASVSDFAGNVAQQEWEVEVVTSLPADPEAPPVRLVIAVGDNQVGFTGRAAPMTLQVKGVTPTGTFIREDIGVQFFVETGGGVILKDDRLRSAAAEVIGSVGYAFASTSGTSTIIAFVPGREEVKPVRFHETAGLPRVQVMAPPPALRLTNEPDDFRCTEDPLPLWVDVLDPLGRSLGPEMSCVEVEIQEDPTTLWAFPTHQAVTATLREFPTHQTYTSAARFSIVPRGTKAGPGQPAGFPKDVVVRLPEFDTFEYQGKSVSEARVPLGNRPPTFSEKRSLASCAAVTAGNWQVFDPSVPPAPIMLDLAPIAQQHDEFLTGSDAWDWFGCAAIQLFVSGPNGAVSYLVKRGASVRLVGATGCVVDIVCARTLRYYPGQVPLEPGPDGCVCLDPRTRPSNCTFGPGGIITWALPIYMAPPESRLVVRADDEAAGFVAAPVVVPYDPFASVEDGLPQAPKGQQRLYIEARLPLNEPTTTSGSVFPELIFPGIAPGITPEHNFPVEDAGTDIGDLAPYTLVHLPLERVGETSRYSIYRTPIAHPIVAVSRRVGQGEQAPQLPEGPSYVQAPGAFLHGSARADLQTPTVMLGVLGVRWSETPATPPSSFYYHRRVQPLPSLAVPDLGTQTIRRGIQGILNQTYLDMLFFDTRPVAGQASNPTFTSLSQNLEHPKEATEEVSLHASDGVGKAEVVAHVVTPGTRLGDEPLAPTLMLGLYANPDTIQVAVWAVIGTGAGQFPSYDPAVPPAEFPDSPIARFWTDPNAVWGPFGISFAPVKFNSKPTPDDTGNVPEVGIIRYPGPLDDGVIGDDAAMLENIMKRGYVDAKPTRLNLYLVHRAQEHFRVRDGNGGFVKDQNGNDKLVLADVGGFAVRGKRAYFIKTSSTILTKEKLQSYAVSNAHELGHALGILGDYGGGRSLPDVGTMEADRDDEVMSHGLARTRVSMTDGDTASKGARKVLDGEVPDWGPR